MMASSRVTEDARKKGNLRVLQRLDPSVVDIIGSATHVVLYEFKDDRQEWEKSNVEGSVFVVKRDLTTADGTAVTSRFKLIILNRNSTENMSVPITGDFQMQLREPYIIIRDTSSSSGGGDTAVIRGIWFHSAEERGALHDLLDRVVRSQSHVADLERRHVKDSSDASEVLAEPTAATMSRTPQRQAAAASGVGSSSNIDAGAAAEALLSPLSLSASTPSSNPVATAQSPRMTETPHTDRAPSSATGVAPTNMVLDKKTLQLTLMSLIQDERFLDLIHAQYLKVAKAKASGHGGGTPGGGKK